MDSKGIPRPVGKRPSRPGQRRWGNGNAKGGGKGSGKGSGKCSSDLTCVNCGRKGHVAANCTMPKVELNKRPCFICGKVGHLARQCPNKSSAPPLKMIADAAPSAPVQSVTVLCCTSSDDDNGVFRAPRKPVPQKRIVGYFITQSAGRRNTNRYRPLTPADLDSDGADDLPVCAVTRESKPKPEKN